MSDATLEAYIRQLLEITDAHSDTVAWQGEPIADETRFFQALS